MPFNLNLGTIFKMGTVFWGLFGIGVNGECFWGLFGDCLLIKQQHIKGNKKKQKRVQLAKNQLITLFLFGCFYSPEYRGRESNPYELTFTGF